MNKNKYVNIHIEGEGNIAVLDLGYINQLDENVEQNIKTVLEPKLVKALEEHFNYPVKIKLTEVLSTLGHVRVRTIVIIDEDEDAHEQTVEMEDTWIY